MGGKTGANISSKGLWHQLLNRHQMCVVSHKFHSFQVYFQLKNVRAINWQDKVRPMANKTQNKMFTLSCLNICKRMVALQSGCRAYLHLTDQYLSRVEQRGDNYSSILLESSKHWWIRPGSVNSVKINLLNGAKTITTRIPNLSYPKIAQRI